MGLLFGFSGRIGRLAYFLSLLGVFVVSVVIMLILAALMTLLGLHRPVTLAVVKLIVGPFAIWSSLALQTKRFRDMGWPPVQAILGLYAVIILDALVAFTVPVLAIGHSAFSGTIMGMMIRIATFGCLLFWPSARGNYMPPAFDDLHVLDTNRPAPIVDRPLPSAGSAEHTPKLRPAPRPAGFGRRSL